MTALRSHVDRTDMGEAEGSGSLRASPWHSTIDLDRSLGQSEEKRHSPQYIYTVIVPHLPFFCATPIVKNVNGPCEFKWHMVSRMVNTVKQKQIPLMCLLTENILPQKMFARTFEMYEY